MHSSATNAIQETPSPVRGGYSDNRKSKKVGFEVDYYDLDPFEQFAERKSQFEPAYVNYDLY